MPYTRPFAIEFGHCDPAGIVFYPRYVEMVNHMAENFFADVIGHPYARVIGDGNGCPTVRLEVDFRAPSRLGERLALGGGQLDDDRRQQSLALQAATRQLLHHLFE